MLEDKSWEKESTKAHYPGSNDINSLVYFLLILFLYIYLLSGMILCRQLVLF